MNIGIDGEVSGHEWAAVGLQNDVTLEEGSLRHSRVDLLWLTDHDGLVFEVVVDDDLSSSGVLETALNDVLFEVTGELQDLSIINKLEIRSSEGPSVHIKRALQL